MNVNVTVSLSGPPSEQYFDSLEAAASKLTNATASICVESQAVNSHYAMITTFTMKTTAQYKVVDVIYRTFKFYAWDFEEYQDMSISFPK